ncbi:MAG: BrnT family toxin [Deltaproteobacteria bacterium]
MKAAKNAANHGVTFDEAKEVFSPDGDPLEEYDLEHSDVERRFRTVGPIRRGIVLVVWTERHADTIRIISARFATPSEGARYRKYIRGGVR